MGVGCYATSAVFFETDVVEDSEDGLEEEEGKDYDADYWVVVRVLVALLVFW